MYEVLSMVYQEFLELFDTDVFHMGGDEVNMNCYNTSKEIREHLELENKIGTEEDILDLWREFQTKVCSRKISKISKKLVKVIYFSKFQAFGLVKKANQDKRMPAILWTNTMTEKGAEKYLDNDDYIIQIWTKGEDHDISDIIKKGYKTIFSNYDAWYFDCGYAGWVSDGNNWCAPYKGKKVLPTLPMIKRSVLSLQKMSNVRCTK